VNVVRPGIHGMQRPAAELTMPLDRPFHQTPMLVRAPEKGTGVVYAKKTTPVPLSAPNVRNPNIDFPVMREPVSTCPPLCTEAVD
jgi:hypothetical protein